MIRAVLLDLDDTLLRNDMAGFLPTYLRSLGEALADLVDPGRLAAEVMAGTRDMLVNQDPRRTLADCFAARFSPALGWNEPDMRPRLQDYYLRVFPELQTLTAPMSGAVELVEALQQAGLELALATNPLFPPLAGEHPPARGRRPGPEEGSAGEILCHRRDVELEVNLPRLQRILTEQDPFLSAVDPDRWAEPRGDRPQAGAGGPARVTQPRMEPG